MEQTLTHFLNKLGSYILIRIPVPSCSLATMVQGMSEEGIQRYRSAGL